MKLQHLEDVNHLVRVRARCEKAIEQANEANWGEQDSGGIAGFQFGYNAFFGKHKDGSGDSIDLNGCYIAGRIAELIVEELQHQIRCVDARLLELGVDLNAVEEEDLFNG